MSTLRKAWKIISKSFDDFFDTNPFMHSAAIAFYTIFSLPGIAIISVMVASRFYEKDAVREQLLNQVTLLMSSSSAEQIEQVMSQAFFSNESLLLKIIGIATLVISTTTVFASLQQSVNTFWRIKPKPKKARKEVVSFVWNRFLSLAMVACIGFLILVSLMADTLLAILREYLSDIFSITSYNFMWVLNTIISLALIAFVFALLFKVLPDVKVKWHHVRVGAFVTTALFVGGKFLIGYYLSKSNLGDAYGAAGSLVALLTWVYYSALIVLYGAQFTYTYNLVLGRKIIPNKEAVAFKIEQVERDDGEVK